VTLERDPSTPNFNFERDLKLSLLVFNCLSNNKLTIYQGREKAMLEDLKETNLTPSPDLPDVSVKRCARKRRVKIYTVAAILFILLATIPSWAIIGNIVYDPKVEAVGIKKLLQMKATQAFFDNLYARSNRVINEVKRRVVQLEKFNVPLDKLGWSQQQKIDTGLKAVKDLQLAVEGKLATQDLTKLRNSLETIYGDAGSNTAVEATYQQIAKTTASLGEIEKQLIRLQDEARQDQEMLASGELSQAETLRYEALMLSRQQEISALQARRDNLATQLNISQTGLMATEQAERYQVKLKDLQTRRQMLKAATVGLALKTAPEGVE
jgi:hypothetical protein